MIQRAIKCSLAIVSCSLFVFSTLNCSLADTTDGPRIRPVRTIQLNGLPSKDLPVVTAVAIQPNGELVATAGDDHVVRIWNINTGRLVRELKGHRDWVTAVSFCSDGSKLITGCRDHQVLVWDMANGQSLGRLGRHESAITSIKVSDEGDKVAVSAFRAPLKIYDLEDRQLLGSLKCPCTDARAAAFSHDMKIIAAGGRTGKLRVWNLSAGTKVDVQVQSRRIWSVIFTPENQLLVAGEGDTISLLDPATGKQRQEFRNTGGKILAMTWLDRDRFATAGADNEIQVFSLSEQKPFAVVSGHTGSISTLDYRDRTLISGSFDTTVRVWSLEPDALVRVAPGRSVSTRLIPVVAE